jgi:hypothetical protein
LFGLTKKSRHGLVERREKDGLIGILQIRDMAWFDREGRRVNRSIAHLTVLVLAVAWFAM